MADENYSIQIEIDPKTQGARVIKKDLKDVASQAKKTGSAVKIMRAAIIAAVGVATVRVILNFTKSVVTMGATFEKTMATVGGVSRATAGELQQLTDIAKEMGATTEFTATQAAQGLQFLAMAGFTVEQSIAALPGTLDLATAGQLSLGRASDIVTDSLTAMGLGVSDLGRLNDVFIATITRSNTNVNMLGDSFRYAAPIASQLGVEVESLAAMFGTLANAGIKGSDAGTDLRQALLRTASAAKTLGLEDGATLVDVLEELNRKQAGVNEVQKLFGIIATKSVLVLKSNIEQYKNLQGELQKSEGEAKKLADTMRNTLQGKFDTLNSSIEAFKMDVFEVFKKDIKDIVVFLIEAVRGAKDLVSTFKELYNLRGVSDTFGQGMEMISSGLIDMSATEFAKLSFIERQKLVDRFEDDLLQLRKTKEQEYTDFKKAQSQDRINEYKSYLGQWGGLFDDEYNKIIKNEEVFLRKFVKNAELGRMAAFGDKKSVGQKTTVAETTKATGPAPLTQVEQITLAKQAYNDFWNDWNTKQTQMTEILMREGDKRKNRSAELLRERIEAESEFSNELDRLIDKVVNKRVEADNAVVDSMRNSLQGMADEYGDIGSQMETTTKNMFSNMEDALLTFVQGGKLSFRDLSEALLEDLQRILIRAMIIKPIIDAITGGMTWTSSGSTAPEPGTQIGAPTPSAKGNIFSGQGIHAFAKGGIVDSPTLFPFAKGTGLMGEAGPEAIMPLARNSNGELGVKSQGGNKAPIVNVQIVKGDSEDTQVEQSTDASGMINTILIAVGSDIANGGTTARSIEGRFGVSPVPQRRGF